MWVLWKLSRQDSTWKYMEGRSIILYLSFSIVVEDKPLCKHRLQKELSEYPLCFKLEYTWVRKGVCVVLHPWMHKTHQMLCWHMQLGLVYLCEVTHTWRKDSHPILHCVSNLKTLEASKLTLLCINHECTRLSKVNSTVLRAWMHMTFKVDFAVLRSWMHWEWYQHVFQSENTWT